MTKQHVIAPGEANRLPIPQEAWLLLQEKALEIVRLNIAAGEVMDPHSNPWRMAFFVLSGSGAVRFEGKEHLLSEGELILIEAGLERQWRNPGETRLKLLVLKVPAG